MGCYCKNKRPNYDLVFQFMASMLNGRNPTIKVLIEFRITN